MICGNLVGGIVANGKSFVIEDVTGSQFTAVLTDELTVLTAKAEDIKLGKTAGTADGIVTGTHECE